MMKKKLSVLTLAVCFIVLVYIVVTAFGIHLPSFAIKSKCNVSLNINDEVIEKISKGTHYDQSGYEYYKKGYIPYKVSLNISNMTVRSFFASVIPKIETEQYIIDIHQFDVPFHNGVSILQNSTIESSIWFKENLTQDEIKDILNDIDLQIELLYYSPPFTANESSTVIDCEFELVD